MEARPNINIPRNAISPPCIMLKQTSDPCPGLAMRFPFPYTSFTELPLMPHNAPVSPRPFTARGRSKIQYSVFSPRHPDLRAAVPALYDKIGIPALHRGHELGLGTYSRVHDPMPADRAAHMAHPLHHLMAMPLLFPAHFIYAPFCSRRCPAREYMACYDFPYTTSPASQGATGLASRRAFRYAISKVRQVLPR